MRSILRRPSRSSIGAGTGSQSVETPDPTADGVPMPSARRQRRIVAVSTHLAMSHTDAAWLRMDGPTNLIRMGMTKRSDDDR
jgi:hypothetical protein